MTSDAKRGANGSPSDTSDAERARLRAAGLTDNEIARILAERQSASSPQQTGAARGRGIAPGVLGHQGSWAATAFNALAHPFRVVMNPQATGPGRVGAGVFLLVCGIALWKSGIIELPFNEIAALNAQSMAVSQPASGGPIYDDTGRSWYSWGARPTINTPLPDDQQKEREKKLIAEQASAEDGGACDVHITPLSPPGMADTISLFHHQHPRDTRRHCILPIDMSMEGPRTDNWEHWERPSPSDPDTRPDD